MRRRLSELGQLEAILHGLPRYQGLRFTTEQAAAITAAAGPVVVVAGAGTGKTTVMAARMAWLVGTGQVEPGGLLGLTFTRQAAHRLAVDAQRMLEALGIDPDDSPTVATYDAFAGSLLADYGGVTGSGGRRLVTGAEPYLIAREAAQAYRGRLPRLAERSWPTVVRAIVGLDGQLQAHLVGVDAATADATALMAQIDRAPLNRNQRVYVELAEARAVAEERLELLELVARYRRAKTELAVTTFADQMADAVGLVDTVEWVGRDCRQRFQAVLLDEYQDTSGAQIHLLTRLFGASGGKPGQAVTAVGDPQQAIYSWRGAAVDNILGFPRAFPGADGASRRPYRLTVNRRSAQPILDTANRLTAEAPDRLVPDDLRVALRAGDDRPGWVEAVETTTWAEECAWLADDIAAGLAAGRSPAASAVLVRRRSQLPQVYQALIDRDVAVAVQGLSGLLWLPLIAQVVAMLRLTVDQRDDQALITVLTGPRFRLGGADLTRLEVRARGLAREAGHDPAGAGPDGVGDGLRLVRAGGWLMAALTDPGPAACSPRLESAGRQIEADLAVIRHSRGPLTERVLTAVTRLGVDIEARLAGGGLTDQVNQFLAAVADYAAPRAQADLVGLVAWLDAVGDYDDGLARVVPSGDAVVVSTIHQAKGLEWETVYLPGLVQGVFPQERLRDNPIRTAAALPTAIRSDAASLDQLEQVSQAGLTAYAAALKATLTSAENRLAYVGLTRAKTRLVGSCHHWEAGRLGPTRPSVYFDIIAEVARHHGRVVDLTGSAPAVNPEPVARPIDWPGPDDPRLRVGAQAVWQADEAAGTTRRRLGGAEADTVADWDRLIAWLERSRDPDRVIELALPSPISTSRLLSASRDPAGLAARWVRPRPGPPRRAAERGAAFHAWIQARYATGWLPDLNPAAGAASDIADVVSSFLASPFADAHPVAVEWEFATVVAGQVVTGRVDAVFTARDNPGLVPADRAVLLVDWKTSRQPADPKQLGLYALAWSRASGTPLAQVDAAFVTWPGGRIRRVRLPDEAELERWVASLTDGDAGGPVSGVEFFTELTVGDTSVVFRK